MLSDLRAFGRWCIADGRIAVGGPFAALQLPKIPQRLPAGLFTPAQTAGPLGLRNRALLEIAAAIGVTSRELAAMRYADVDAVTGHVTVSPLERGAPRTVPLSSQASTWLRRYLAEARPEILAGRPEADAPFVTQHGRPMDPGDVAHVAREAAKRVDLPTRRVLSTLKDSLAVQLLENGCDPRYLAALFGHADLQSVRKYQRLSVQRLQEVHRRCHPAEQPRSGCGEA